MCGWSRQVRCSIYPSKSYSCQLAARKRHVNYTMLWATPACLEKLIVEAPSQRRQPSCLPTGRRASAHAHVCTSHPGSITRPSHCGSSIVICFQHDAYFFFSIDLGRRFLRGVAGALTTSERHSSGPARWMFHARREKYISALAVRTKATAFGRLLESAEFSTDGQVY